jgi:hypothetical protein
MDGIRTLTGFLAFPTRCTDILGGAPGIATDGHSARGKQQKHSGSVHDFSLRAILEHFRAGVYISAPRERSYSQYG